MTLVGMERLILPTHEYFCERTRAENRFSFGISGCAGGAYPLESGTLRIAMRQGYEEAGAMCTPLSGSLGTQTGLPSSGPLCQQDCSEIVTGTG